MRFRKHFGVVALAVFVGLSHTAAAVSSPCDPGDPSLVCEIKNIAGVPITHYRLKNTPNQSRILLWLQKYYPSIFGHASPFNRSIALLVGVASYDHLTPLPNVHKDLVAMRNYLLTNEQFDDVFVLEDTAVSNLSLSNVMRNYFATKQGVGESDRFLFYYSGHGTNEKGTGELQFDTYDRDVIEANSTLSVSLWEDWGRWLMQNKAKQVLFLFDACALGNQISRKGSDIPDPELLANISADSSCIAFAATRGGEAAYGDEDTSYFTNEFLRVVQSGRADSEKVGFMTIDLIAQLMETRLAKVAKEHHLKWYYTTPTRLNSEKYPGTFVFINPKVPMDAEENYKQAIVKGDENLRSTLSEPRVARAIPVPTPVPTPTPIPAPTPDKVRVAGIRAVHAITRVPSQLDIHDKDALNDFDTAVRDAQEEVRQMSRVLPRESDSEEKDELNRQRLDDVSKALASLHDDVNDALYAVDNIRWNENWRPDQGQPEVFRISDKEKNATLAKAQTKVRSHMRQLSDSARTMAQSFGIQVR
jgi:hypothetical protein